MLGEVKKMNNPPAHTSNRWRSRVQVGDLVRIRPGIDVNSGKLAIITYLIGHVAHGEVEVWCNGEPWIYRITELEVCNEVS